MAEAKQGEGTYKCNLTPELVEKAKTELNEKSEWRARDIQALREMVKGHKGLHCRTDDEYLLRYLRAKKFDYDRAYKQIVQFFTMKSEYADILKELRPSAVRAPMDDGVSFILPKPDKLGRLIFYFRPGKWDPAKYPVYDILRLNILNLETAILREFVQINGLVVIGNMQDVGWAHAKSLDRTYFKVTSSLMQDAFPMRMKSMNLVNEPTIFGYIFALVKPFMNEKFTARMHFHGSDLAALYKEVDPEFLPEDLGGKLAHSDKLAEEWKAKLLTMEDYFTTEMQYNIELDRKIMSQKDSDNVECLTGTYKKLNVD